jgi:uncharacterized membrane protein
MALLLKKSSFFLKQGDILSYHKVKLADLNIKRTVVITGFIILLIIFRFFLLTVPKGIFIIIISICVGGFLLFFAPG